MSARLPAPEEIAAELCDEPDFGLLHRTCAQMGARAAYNAVREALEAEAAEHDAYVKTAIADGALVVATLRHEQACALRAFATRLPGGAT